MSLGTAARYVTATLLFCSCGLDDRIGDARPVVVEHPIIEKADTAGAVVLIKSSPEVNRLATALERRRPVVSIGSIDSAETALGNPVDIAVDESGNAHVLDAMFNEVRIFDEEGSYLRSVGRSGDGPLEMRYPVGLELLSDGTLVVGQSSGYTLIEQTADGFYEQRASIPVGAVPSPVSFCVTSGGIAQRSASHIDNGIVTLLALDGTIRERFGGSYVHGGIIVREDLSVGPIACSPGNVIAAYAHLPYIDVFSLSGEREGRYVFPDFSLRRFEERSNGGNSPSSLRHIASPGNLVLTAHTHPSNVAIIQVASLGAADARGRQEIVGLATYAVDLLEKNGKLISTNLPHILAMGVNWFWAREEGGVGFPVVTKYSY
ncbi:hypothetical protein BH23GEM10_BH23GEM10_03680 [soil metagenome]